MASVGSAPRGVPWFSNPPCVHLAMSFDPPNGGSFDRSTTYETVQLVSASLKSKRADNRQIATTLVSSSTPTAAPPVLSFDDRGLSRLLGVKEHPIGYLCLESRAS